MSAVRQARRRPTATREPTVDRGNGLRLTDVSKTYRSRRGTVNALAPVSLDIAAGSLVAVVGRSGCGKSTLLRIMAGLTEPTSGTVEIGEHAVHGPPPQARFVFQDYGNSLLAWRSVARNVRLGLEHSSTGTGATPEHYLDLVGLVGVGDRYPWELSGGMQQRVAIARALASGSRVLFLDEPFSAVDALSRARLQDLLQRLWSELGLTVVFVTHDVDEAIYLADRVVVLAPDGAGIQADIPVDLPRPRHQVTTRESPEFLDRRRRLASLLLEVEA